MELKELMHILDIENPEEFIYFEQFSDLIENTEDIDHDLLFELLDMVLPYNLADMTGNYFDDIISGVPDDDMELYSTFTSIRDLLVTLAEASAERREKILYSEELFNFRNWYLFNKSVSCTSISTGIVLTTSVNDALILYRLEKLSEDKYEYDFNAVLPYKVDDYVLSVFEELQAVSDFYDEEADPYHDELIDDYDFVNEG